MVTREQLLAASAASFPTTEIDVPEWGGVIRLRGLSVAARLDLQRLYRQADADYEAIALSLVMASIVGPDGEPMFGPGDRDAVQALEGRGFMRVLDAARALNRMNGDDEAALGNSETTPESVSVIA